MARLVRDWLVHCADPEGSRHAAPAQLPAAEAARDLVRQADMHGVLPALLRSFPFDADPALAVAQADARTRHRNAVAFSFLLRSVARELMALLEGEPVTVMKGPVFAEKIYPDPSLRSFTDIDLLAAPDVVPRAAMLLEDQGFILGEVDDEADPQEWKWIHRDNPNLMIEVQTNLVHRRDLRLAVSVPYAHIAEAPTSPSALLLIALVHAGLGHRYKRLQHIVDICQAARAVSTAGDEPTFMAMVARCNARFLAVVGLDLAARMFDEPSCRDLARKLGPAAYSGLARLLIGRDVVTSRMERHGWVQSIRRLPFRFLIKLAAERNPPANEVVPNQAWRAPGAAAPARDEP